MGGDRLAFDDRLLNKYAVEDLGTSFPTLLSALSAWFSAFGDFDDTAIDRITAARSPADVERLKAPAQAALASIPAIVAGLDAVIAELDAALVSASKFPERAQLEGLREAAATNRRELTEHAPALVAAATGDTAGYDAARAVAQTAVKNAAARLDAMRERSADAALTFRDMQPMIAELRHLWTDVNRALESLSRGDQRDVRGPFDEQMRDAAQVVCRNLFARKMRDIAAGSWPRPIVARSEGGVANRFTAAIALGEFGATRDMLAPWLVPVWPPDRIGREVTAYAEGAAREAGSAAAPLPAAYHVEVSELALSGLAEHRQLPAEITAANYRGWCLARIETDEEDAYLTNIDVIVTVYLAIVQTPAGERIGFITIGE